MVCNAANTPPLVSSLLLPLYGVLPGSVAPRKLRV